ALVFDGGLATGSFGGAPTFAAPLRLNDDPSGGDSFTVQLYASDTLSVAEYVYDSSVFTGSCTTACASQTRVPEDPTGTMQPHTTVPFVHASPGVAQADAVPKLLASFSLPQATAAGVSITAF